MICIFVFCGGGLVFLVLLVFLGLLELLELLEKLAQSRSPLTSNV